MTKTTDERLFELLMRAPHRVRKALTEGGEGRPARGRGQGGPCRHNSFGPQGPGFGGHHGPGFGGPGAPFGPRGGHERRPGHERERLLRTIGSFEGGANQKALAEELRINASSVSELVTKLEDDGYVKRTVDPSDKRATLITLTELGEARAAELEDEKADRFAKAFGKLAEEEKLQLIALLEKLLEKDEPAGADR